MKIFVACLLFAVASAELYKYPPSNACRLLQVTASLDVQEISNNEVIKTRTIDLSKENINVSGEACNGNGTATNLVLTLEDQSKLTLTFTRSDATVELFTMYQFNPNITIDNGDDVNLFASFNALPLSSPDTSFSCVSSQSMDSNVANSSDHSYKVRFTAVDMKVQAFNVKNDAFSDSVSCKEDQDPTTTDQSSPSANPSTPTENPDTSSSNPDTTTAAPDTTTTTMVPDTTTTVPGTTAAPLPVSTFKLMDENNETCIEIQLSDQIFAAYEKTDNTTGFAKDLMIPDTAGISGECPTNGTAVLTLTYDADVMEFHFTDTDSMSSLDTINYNYTLDSTRFPEAKNPDETLAVSVNLNEIRSKDDTFFSCISLSNLTFPDSQTYVLLSNLKVQAFNLNSTFTGAGESCSADQTTTAPMTTSTMAPVTSTVGPDTKPPINNYTVDTCILVRSGLTLKLPYTKKGSVNTTQEFQVPKEFKVGGQCSNTSQSMTITFFTNWVVEFVFGKTASLTAGFNADENVAYALENVTVTYFVNDMFTDPANVGEKRVLSTTNGDFFPVSSDQTSYMCKSKTSIKLGDGNIQTDEFQYRAFSNSNSTDFANSGVNECAADSDSNSVVPIAVGAALAGLVVIVLIAYLIGRRRSKRAGYESV